MNVADKAPGKSISLSATPAITGSGRDVHSNFINFVLLTSPWRAIVNYAFQREPPNLAIYVNAKREEVMLRSKLIATVVAMGVVGFSGTYACAQEFFAHLIGVNENPSILSDGSGTFTLNLDRRAGSATFVLTFSGLSAPATQGHIHFSKSRVNGGIIVWLCQSATNPGPAGTQDCPPGGGTVTGTITAGTVVPVDAQLVAAGDFDALTDALTSNSAYANVHSTAAPGGEIRGQIRERDKDED